MSEGIIVNPNPAQLIAVDPSDTWADYAERVQLKSKKPLQHGNGEAIVLEPDCVYSSVLLKMVRTLTSSEFETLLGGIMHTIDQLEKAGMLPKGIVKVVSTPFDINTPEVPEQFLDEAYDYKVILEGATWLVMVRVPK